MFSPPLFPLEFAEVPARVTFHEVPDQTWELEGVRIDAEPLSHPGPTAGYRLSLGEAATEGEVTRMKVERVLPFHPLMNDNREMWNPSPETYNGLMGRLKHETERRGVPIPTIPTIKPEPTAGARLRMARRAVAPPPRDAGSGRGVQAS